MLNKRLPNVILLTIDCWRADYLGYGQDGHSPTPHLDRLAAKSLVFNQAITCGGWTRPSITALLSSTYASMYGGPLGQYSTLRPSLSETLCNHGYETAGFTTNPQVGRAFGFERGFDAFFELLPDDAYAGPRWSKIKGAQRLLVNPLTHFLLGPTRANTLPPEVTSPAEEVCTRIMDWLSEPQDEPVFVWAHFMDAHWPYHVLRCSYRPEQKAQFWRDLQLGYRIAKAQGYLNPGQGQVDRLRWLYTEALRYLDEQLNLFVESLRSSGRWENTVLILTSDHGEEFYEHGRWSHYQLYDESLRVPLIIHLPEEQGKSVERQVSLLDLTPTILALCGVPAQQGMLGTDLLAQANDQNVNSKVAYAEAMWSDNYRLAIRTEDYKYLFESKKPDECQLFDIRSDPDERRNIYAEQPTVSRQFEDLRQDHLDRAKVTAGKSEKATELDQALLDRLQALGYME